MRTPLTLLSTVAATLCFTAPALAQAGHSTTRHTSTKASTARHTSAKASTAHHRNGHRTNRRKTRHHGRRVHRSGPAARAARRGTRKRIRRHIVAIRRRTVTHRHSAGKTTAGRKTSTTAAKTATSGSKTTVTAAKTTTTGKTTVTAAKTTITAAKTTTTGSTATVSGTSTTGAAPGGATDSGSTTTVGSLSSGGSAPFFAGTFTSPNRWPSVYGGCAHAVSNTDVQFDITSACNPGSDGHYRTDLCSSPGCKGNGSVASGDVYQAGQPTCTSVPVDVINVPTVPTSGWMMFAEAKDYSAARAGWGMYLNSYYGGVNEFESSFPDASDTAWFGTMSSGWHTLSICTNNANNSSGQVYGIYEDGQRLTFNHGGGAGQQSVGGFPIIDNGMSSWPLDIDDYTGGAPSNTIVTGAPLVSAGTDNPPMPAGGWNNA